MSYYISDLNNVDIDHLNYKNFIVYSEWSGFKPNDMPTGISEFGFFLQLNLGYRKPQILLDSNGAWFRVFTGVRYIPWIRLNISTNIFSII